MRVCEIVRRVVTVSSGFAYVQECMCLCASVRSFPWSLGKKVERPASEENSILNCSYTVINHPSGMSNTVIL